MAHQTFDPNSTETLVELLRWRATHQSDDPAYVFLVDGDEETVAISYSDLDRQARGLAARLQTVDGCGERALLLYPPGLDFLVAFFGCLYAGVVAVPLYPPRLNRPDRRLQAIADDAGVKFALTTAQTTENLEKRLQHSPALGRMQWIATDTVDFTDETDGWHHPAKMRADLAYLQYTSGSTSAPKGVMVSHGNLMYNLAYIRHAVNLTAASKSVTWLPHFHDMGLVDGLLSAVFNGFPGYLMAPNAFLQQPIRWLAAVSRFGITHTGGPNFAFDLCVSGTTPEQRAALDLSGLQSIYNGAEPVRWTTIRHFADTFERHGLRPTALYPVYGLAEATLMVSGGVLAEPVVSLGVNAAALAEHRIEVEAGPEAQMLVGCGREMLETRIVVVHPETLTRCGPYEVGEIWLGGPSVTQGYWQHPQITAATFGARLAHNGDGPFFRTGDLGFVRDGELFVTGRLKDLIIIRGRNHYPQDIELTVEQCHPVLRQNSGAAFPVEVAGEERLVIVQEVERTAVRDLDVETVAGAIREAVAEEHELQVHAIHFIRPGSVPKTSSGKIQRQACRTEFMAGSLKTVGEWVQPLSEALVDQSQTAHRGGDPPPTVEAIQAWLANQIAMRLDLDPTEIDIREEFTSYGLDSMELISVSGFLEQWLGRTLSPNVMYDFTTIADLAAYLAEGEAVSG